VSCAVGFGHAGTGAVGACAYMMGKLTGGPGRIQAGLHSSCGPGLLILFENFQFFNYFTNGFKLENTKDHLTEVQNFPNLA
jgi:hypothetical protein